jgi:hypothetical protein
MNLSSRKGASYFRRLAVVLAMTVAALSLSGCGNGLSKVSGQVTIDGQPVDGSKGSAFVLVQFTPVSGKGANGTGVADESGRYSVATGSQTGLSPGEYYVTCTVRAEKPSAPTPDPKFSDPRKSGLKCVVESGSNTFDVPLQSRAKKPPQTGA